MVWQVLNRLFGWEYAHLRNTATGIIRHVHRTNGGERFVRYYSGELIFIDRNDHFWSVTDLTHHPRMVNAKPTPQEVKP